MMPAFRVNDRLEVMQLKEEKNEMKECTESVDVGQSALGDEGVTFAERKNFLWVRHILSKPHSECLVPTE
jgi:hypothetical protein